MITKYKVLFLTGLVFLFSLISVSSCKKVEDEPGDAPELPPAEAFLMDFSDFSNPDDTLQGKKAFVELMNGYTYRNWGYSFLTVSFWNTIASVTLVVPTTSYLKTLENNPVYKGNNTWEWNATYTLMNANFEAKLVATRVSNEEYLAEMYISKDGPLAFTDFKWFEGIIRYDHTHAIWTLYEGPSNPIQLIDVEWNRDWEADTGDIRYTYVKAGTGFEGSFIDFKFTNDPIFDAKYTVDLVGDSTVIEWNTTDKNGRVRNLTWFGDQDWHCWNDLLQDASCQ
jgi:hypothetical protein